MTIKCMILDDEPLAIRLLESYVSKVPFLKLQVACLNAIQAVSILEQEEIDLLFLDIQMPDMSGITFLKNLRKPPLVILTTAHQEYAIDGYALNVIDYFLKPISFERFLFAATRVKEYLTNARQKVLQPSISDFIFIKSEFKIIKLIYGDILFFEGLKDYTKIYVKGKPKPVLTLQSLKTFENKLPPDIFLRVHRSFIISILHIDVVTKNTISVGDTVIPVSDSYRKALFTLIENKS